MRLPALILATACLTSGAFTATARAAGSASYFTSVGVGSMVSAREYSAAAVLPNGQVLIAGGHANSSYLASAELYNPATEAFTTTGSMTAKRGSAAAAALDNGQVLMAGGANSGGDLASAELYNPSTGTFTATGSMTTVRYAAAAATLPNGQVLVAGGHNSSGFLASAELYNPATGAFTATGSLNTARDAVDAATLPNGEVLIVGGQNSGGDLASAELYNPATGKFTATGSMATARYAAAAATLPNGQVLIVGGYSGSYLASAELYNPATGTFTATAATMTTPRYGAAAATLPNGQVLIASGGNGSGTLASAELYVPAPQALFTGGSFGQQTVKKSSTGTPITITNIGAQALNISALALAGANPKDFKINAAGCTGASLAFRQSCTITASFDPQAAGARTAKLTLVDNEPTSTTIPLTGTGTTVTGGKVQLITCTTRTVKHKTVRKCTSKLVSGAIAGKTISAKIMRGKRQLATAKLAVNSNGRMLIQPSRVLSAGNYTLVYRQKIGKHTVTVKRAITIH